MLEFFSNFSEMIESFLASSYATAIGLIFICVMSALILMITRYGEK